MNRDVLCGIVTYNPDIKKLKENINAIVDQVSLVLLIDNGSENSEIVKSLNNEKIAVICLKKNNGIAYALNEVLRYADKKKFKWLYFLDQDSISPSNIIKKYISVWRKCENCGMLSPNIKYKNGPNINPKESLTEIEWCITSGSFTSIEILKQTQGFDECMFIDLVDLDICYQLKKSGYSIYRVNDIIFYHELGNLKCKKVGNKIIWIENHNAFRKYFIIRNRIYIKKKYNLKGGPIYIDILIEYMKVLFFEKGKLKKIKKMTKGLIDGYNMNMS